MEIFKEASKLQLRIQTSKGELSVEQLWDLPLDDLDKLAANLEKEYEKTDRKTFLKSKTTKKDRIAKLKFDIVVEILNTLEEEFQKYKEDIEIKKHNQKIDALIASKLEKSLEEKTIEELEAMRK